MVNPKMLRSKFLGSCASYLYFPALFMVSSSGDMGHVVVSDRQIMGAVWLPVFSLALHFTSVPVPSAPLAITAG
jgi:hypothetical protein